MEEIRKAWSKRQVKLREVLLSFDRPQEAISLFMTQHAMVHSAVVAEQELPSFEDELLDGMNQQQIRRIPQSEEHSIAWLLWHMARIEDVTMTILVAGQPQLFTQAGWHQRLGVTVQNTGNAMDEATIRQLGQAVDIEALRAYRQAVGRQTREIIRELSPEQWKQKVDPSRLQQVLDQGAVLPEAQGVIDYWGRRTIAGLLLMPPTRHNFIHLNEAQRIKRRK